LENIKVKWYKTEIDKETLKELKQRSNVHGFTQSFLQLAIGSGTAYFSFYAWYNLHWGIFALALFVHSAYMGFLSVVAACHELSHGTAFKSKGLNNFFYYIFSFISWSNPVLFKASHSHHHRYTLLGQHDQEAVLPGEFRVRDFLKSFILSPPFWWQPLSRHWKHSLGQLTSEWDKNIFPDSRPKKRRQLANWARFIIYGHLVLMVISILFGYWILIPIILFPAYGGWFAHLFGAAQHLGMQSGVPDFRRNSRTMILNPVGAFLYWQMNYHTEHHMFPAVPFYNLRKLHKLLHEDGAPEPNHGLWDAWKEIRMIQKKQRETPGVAFDAFSRGKEPAFVPQNDREY